MAMRSEEIPADPYTSVLVIVTLALILWADSIAGRVFLDPPEEIALVYATSMRNLSIAIAIAAAPGFPPTSAVGPIALADILQPSPGGMYALPTRPHRSGPNGS